MKIGILTFHNTINYGATLQACALQQIITTQGHDVEIINYCPDQSFEFYGKQLSPFKVDFPYINRHFLVKRKRLAKFDNFVDRHMKISDKYHFNYQLKNHLHQKYDAVLCGSDEVWKLNSFRGFDPSYFLDFVDKKNTTKISYAPSFGSTKSLGNNREIISRLLKDFDFISVRDSHSARLVEEVCNKQVVKVLDPTFLIDYQNLISVPRIDQKYMLIYGRIQGTAEENKFIKSLAKQRNLIILSVVEYNKIAHKNILDISIPELLGYYAQASYVFSTAYHGTIFSLIFKKPFTVSVRGGKSNKVNDLLNDLGLISRIFSPQTASLALANQSLDMDYSMIDNILKTKISYSKEYLFNALRT
jgi:polysaccharide pyruvyl transferase WcaK-like protein